MKMIETKRTIFITDADMRRLKSLIETMKTSREHLDGLSAELNQAQVVAPADIPKDVVTMNSRVQVRDLETDEVMIYTLVFPGSANIDDGKLSVLAPIGTAMLGHRAGEEFQWYVPGGPVRLRVEEVLYQPEAAGHYNL